MRRLVMLVCAGLWSCGGIANVDGSGGSKSVASASSSASSSATGAGPGAGGFDGTPECTRSDECTLCNDCCSCLGVPDNVPCPACEIQECFAPMCNALGFTNFAPVCATGRCVAGFPCDYSMVVCAEPPPPCAPGETVMVVNGCWGPCVVATQCASVADCTQCDPATQVCVSESAFGLTAHCVERPASCQGKSLCDCMGASVCVTPFDACSEVALVEISCGCPTC